jgi:VIT1/CCC1 family predicted Fe2+/Mn2+ transporter
MLKKLANIMPDVSVCLFLLGIIAVFFGVYQLSIPISYIVLGILLIATGLVKARAEVIAKANPIGEN